MILALCLLLVGGGLVLGGPRVLTGWTTTGRRPVAGLLAWQLASWSALVSVLLAAALLASPRLAAVGRLPAGVESCLHGIHHLANPAGNLLLRAMAVALLVGVVVRLLECAGRTALANHRCRARHRVLLRLVGRRDGELQADVVDDDTAVVYCLPGHGGRVVFTSAAVNRLTTSQRSAVLTHERAHLRGRHHLLVSSATLLARTFPGVRLFAQAREQTARLVEMRADDIAVRGHGRRPVAEALLALADTAAPGTALAATGVTTTARIERLLTTPTQHRSSPLRGLARGASTTTAFGVFAASPMLLAIASHAALCLI